MINFFVDFDKNGETFTLQFQVYNNPISIKWKDCLTKTLEHNPKIKETDRLYQFNKKWNKDTIFLELNRNIDIVNSWKECIKLRASDNQDILNSLHKDFELMRGNYKNSGEFYLSAPLEVKKAIEDFNVTIHRLEDLIKSKDPKPRVVITFEHTERHLLDDQDYDYFSLDINFGEVFINYCEIGKPIWDVYRDDDHIVGDENIRPLRYYSAEMQIAFFHGTYKNSIEKFWNWFDLRKEFLNHLGFQKYDKKLSIGHIPVARLISNLDESIILRELSECNYIKKVYF
jgi:hypothetical protein